MRDSAYYRRANKEASEVAIEMNAKMLPVAQIQRLRMRIERGPDQPTIGADHDTLDGRTRQNRDLPCPRIYIRSAIGVSPHPLGDDLHARSDTIERVGNVVGEGGGEVSSFEPGVIHRRGSCNGDRAKCCRPQANAKKTQGDDDGGDCQFGAANGVAGN
jgi:hypothetical protein